ncbi:hypothetical protein MHYP_G00224250 [Metynnis hypsauchen]
MQFYRSLQGSLYSELRTSALLNKDILYGMREEKRFVDNVVGTNFVTLGLLEVLIMPETTSVSGAEVFAEAMAQLTRGSALAGASRTPLRSFLTDYLQAASPRLICL